ncbi:MAG TPA: hypothetical protein VM537_20830 [Anaerolineae bacterium]|nr:hypothetical protein [Anaerolineae bacterium]
MTCARQGIAAEAAFVRWCWLKEVHRLGRSEDDPGMGSLEGVTSLGTVRK